MKLLPRRSPATMAASSSLSLFILLATAVQAQNTQNTDTTATQAATNTQTTAQTTNTDTAKTTAAATTAGSLTDLPNLSSVTDSGTSTTAPTTAVTDAPSLTSTNTVHHLSDLPTIAGYGVPTQIVPWTAGAPFMQRSSLPDGTVFIVVGAILGFMGVAILTWRGLVAWSLHRSVRKAALASQRNDSMLKLSKPSGPYGGGAFGASTMSLERLSTPTGKLSKHAPGHSLSSPAGRNSSLFFSPTAGAGNHSSPTAASMAGNNRSSAFLPAGYYAAAGAASPGGGVVPGSTPSPLSTLNPLHPSRAGYARQTDYAPSPPGSPSITPSRPSTEGLGRGNRGYAGGYERSSGYGRPSPETGLYSQGSNSILNLHVPGGKIGGGRAPSANLEEMFENHNNGSRERY
jgi:hypothetical protein